MAHCPRAFSCSAQRKKKWVREMAALCFGAGGEGTLRKHGADNDASVFTVGGHLALAARGGQMRFVLSRLEVYFCVVICVAFMY